MLGGREGARAHVLGIGADGILDYLADLAELLDEARHARAEAQHVLHDEDLAVAGERGADADGRNGNRRGDALRQGLGDRFEHDGKGAGLGHRARILQDGSPFAAMASLRLEAADDVHRLRA